ncbi:TPA: oligosaccharide flippase family protein [Vibrio vulnificus]|nr:oligosaccharide flippase family protein [Vibrio vulnificus]HDY8099851.1 O-antigen translocase [Vibrio vulnificus]
MSFLRVTSLNSISVFVKIAVMLWLNKILAIAVGPSGYAAIGQFQNAIQVITSLSNGVSPTGIIKYTAENTEADEIHRLWKTAGTTTLLFSLIGSFIVFFNSEALSEYIFNSKELESCFYWLSASLPFIAFNALFVAILNGKKEFKSLVVANILGSVLSAISVPFLVYFYELEGALIGLAIYQGLALFSTIWICNKHQWFHVKFFVGYIERKVFLKLLKYLGAGLVTALSLPVALMFIRSVLIDSQGDYEAGNWEAMLRLSNGYLMLITTATSVYLLPRFSELNSANAIFKELINALKLIFIFVGFMLVCINMFKGVIVPLILSKDFNLVYEIMPLYMFGDFLKVMCYVITYLFIAKEKLGLFIFSEVFFTILYAIAAKYLISMYGVDGAIYSYVITYSSCLVFLLLMLFIYKKNNLFNVCSN